MQPSSSSASSEPRSQESVWKTLVEFWRTNKQPYFPLKIFATGVLELIQDVEGLSDLRKLYEDIDFFFHKDIEITLNFPEENVIELTPDNYDALGYDQIVRLASGQLVSRHHHTLNSKTPAIVFKELSST